MILLSCSHSPQKGWEYLSNPKEKNINPSQMISESALRYDKDELLYALKNVYSGSQHLPKMEFRNLISDIENIGGSMRAIEFCKKIALAFEQVSDNHLRAKFTDNGCHGEVKTNPRVGKNFYSEANDIPWAVKLEKIKNKNVLFISITSFPQNNSPKWNGFLEKVSSHLTSAKAVVLDMRGNGGGDDSYGFRLAELLSGTKNLKAPYADQWQWNKPESFQLFVNLFSDWENYLISEGKPVPPYIIEKRDEFAKKRDEVIAGSFKAEDRQKHENLPISKSLRPLFILIDKECASSCESTTDYFEYVPNTTTVGENTAGFIHFSNNGLIILKNSGVMIQMATTFNTYRDGRFIEKKGITPKWIVPPGQNALDFVKKRL